MPIPAGVRYLTLAVLASSLATAAMAPAIFTWTGNGTSNAWTNAANWTGGVAPANDGSSQITFGVSARSSVLVDSSQSIDRLVFDFSAYSASASYTLSNPTGRTLTLGSGGLNVISASAPNLVTSASAESVIANGFSIRSGAVFLEQPLGLVLAANQTWTLDANSAITVSSTMSGPGKLTLAGEGSATLKGNNTFAGGTLLEGGKLAVTSNSALGTGTLTVSDPSTLLTSGGHRILTNALQLDTTVFDVIPVDGTLTLTGRVTLGASTTLNNRGDILFLVGNIDETGGARALTLNGTGGVVLTGNNSYTGGTAVYGGILVFGNAASVPLTGALTSQANGYIGIGFSSGIQSGFISKFDPANTYGTIGFDTDLGALNPAQFSQPVSLASFNNYARIGSATRATFSSNAAITPGSGGYRFGGGGGTLTVDSKLTGQNSVTVDSSQGNELTLRLTSSTNDYVGATTASRSAIVFNSSALPPLALGTFILESGGYIGVTVSDGFAASGFISRFALNTLTGIIGFNSGTVSDPIVLSSFAQAGTSIALGTSSSATLSGPITLPLLQSSYHFAGYKGGALTVSSTLSNPLVGSYSVRIGDEYHDYPLVDRNDPTRISTVTLAGSNTYSGGTYLHSGKLVLGHSSALGSGALIIRSNRDGSLPQLETSLTNPSYSNPVIAENSFEFNGSSSLTLAGALSSTGNLWKSGASTLTLSGNNAAFAGDFYINGGTLAFVGATAVGSGVSDINFGLSGGIATFAPAGNTSTAAPSIGGLSSATNTAQVHVASGTTLTINQPNHTVYQGSIQGAGGVVKSGAGTLNLQSSSSYTGGTTITNGRINVAATSGLGTGNVTLNGLESTLLVQSGATLSNTLSFGSNGGRLGGNGTFASGVVLGPNSGIAPGNSVGLLTFTGGLTWAGGGFFELEVQDPNAGPGTGWDAVQVNGILNFTATLSAPFTIHLSSLTNSGASGNISNFIATNSYSLQIASATGGITGFNPNAVQLNTTGFTNPLEGGSFALLASGNNLMLTFTPVPEPSTWMLMLTGATVLALNLYRRRRRN